MTGKSIPVAAEEIIWRVVDDGAVLISPEAGEVRVLNPVGTKIWQLVDGARSTKEIAAELVATYDISSEQAASDVLHFLDQLAKRDLIVWRSDSPAG
ncbi:MAG: PqqD family protein [Candidatus Promineifilaceae bacterium]|nr:PqqD family protein [Candidatus Promineifilaceae bacterium]